MEELSIKDYIRRELSPGEQKITLDFVNYLEERSLGFYKDDCGCWKDKIYYWVTLKDRCVCFIAIKDPDEKENSWTVWSDDIDTNQPVCEEVKEYAWHCVDHCINCGSCGGGRRKNVFDREFDDVCGCTFRIDDPDAKALAFLKTMVDMRIKAINGSEK